MLAKNSRSAELVVLHLGPAPASRDGISDKIKISWSPVISMMCSKTIRVLRHNRQCFSSPYFMHGAT